MKEIHKLKTIINNNSGMTLVEVIVSVSILMIIIIPIYSYYINTIYFVNHLEHKEIALLLAQKEMEILKIKQFSDLKEGITSKEVSMNDLVFYSEIIVTGLKTWVKKVEIIIYKDNDKLELVTLQNKIIRRK